MSYLFGGGRQQPTSAQKIEMAEAELELITDMYNKLAATCNKKCIPSDYREGDLNKGESVCLDRCVAKYMEANMKISQKMQSGQAAPQASSGGGFFG